jgi:hypothetical protein
LWCLLIFTWHPVAHGSAQHECMQSHAQGPACARTVVHTYTHAHTHARAHARTHTLAHNPKHTLLTHNPTPHTQIQIARLA